jgi:hypothetical protein
LFVSSVLFVFWYHSPNFLDTPHTTTVIRHLLTFKFKSIPSFEMQLLATVCPSIWEYYSGNAQSLELV